jgi:hypothetical protein
MYISNSERDNRLFIHTLCIHKKHLLRTSSHILFNNEIKISTKETNQALHVFKFIS